MDTQGRTSSTVRFAPLLLAALALTLSGCGSDGLPTEFEKSAGEPQARSAGNDRMPDQYIVVFKREVRDAPGLARELVLRSPAGGWLGPNETALLHVYEHALKGFAARLSPQAAEALAHNPNVAYVVKDTLRSVMATVQSAAPWGLDRIDQRDLPLDSTYTYSGDGSGVTVFIIDSGIRYAHEEFGGRATFAFDVFGGDGGDCNGHGTHVAATVGGSTYGVAKRVTLRSVRVVDCVGYGTISQGIAGIDWVAQQKQASPGTAMVANMSLGGPLVKAEIEAVQNTVAAGVTFVVAASNANANACGYSPAAAPDAITVGATTAADARSSFSNWGTCVDIFAPGTNITSAWITSNTATRTMSGTSMAAPHVAGVAALYLQNNPGALPATVTSAIVSASTSGRITDAGTGSPNRLLFWP